LLKYKIKTKNKRKIIIEEEGEQEEEPIKKEKEKKESINNSLKSLRLYHEGGICIDKNNIIILYISNNSMVFEYVCKNNN
jgi:hypothetical protein